MSNISRHFLLSFSEDIGDAEREWKLQFHEWRTKYIVDWKLQYENYMKEVGGCRYEEPAR